MRPGVKYQCVKVYAVVVDRARGTVRVDGGQRSAAARRPASAAVNGDRSHRVLRRHRGSHGRVCQGEVVKKSTLPAHLNRDPVYMAVGALRPGPLVTASGQSNLTKRPRSRRTQTVQSYSPGGANVHRNLKRDSLGPPSAYLKLHQDLYSRFCTTHGRGSRGYNGPPLFPLSIAPSHGDLHAITCFHVPSPLSLPNGISIGSAVFAQHANHFA